jgi:hypothetical protein
VDTWQAKTRLEITTMTAKELFEKYGSVWLSLDHTTNRKNFRPLGFTEDGSRIIGEDSEGDGSWIDSDVDGFALYQPPKQKVVRWKWAYKSMNGQWVETSVFCSEREAIYLEVTAIKLEYTATTFEE